jgi:hypothetical protein
MRPEPGQVLHFSEDPSITGFAPHIAATAQQPEAYVWAVNAEQAPSYWFFPRACPRVMAWVAERTTVDDRDRILGRESLDLLRCRGGEQPRLQWHPAAERTTPALTDGLCGGVRLRRSNL